MAFVNEIGGHVYLCIFLGFYIKSSLDSSVCFFVMFIIALYPSFVFDNNAMPYRYRPTSSLRYDIIMGTSEFTPTIQSTIQIHAIFMLFRHDRHLIYVVWTTGSRALHAIQSSTRRVFILWMHRYVGLAIVSLRSANSARRSTPCDWANALQVNTQSCWCHSWWFCCRHICFDVARFHPLLSRMQWVATSSSCLCLPCCIHIAKSWPLCYVPHPHSLTCYVCLLLPRLIMHVGVCCAWY